MSLLRPIHHTFGPHVTLGYCLRTLGILLAPWKYKKGKSMQELRASIEHFFGGDAFLFATGRESLLALFRAMGLRPGEEIIVQGYTCVVLPNAIHAAGGVPVYCDIDRETLNLNITSVKNSITPRTRAIICQHTFGIPAENLSLRSLCDEHGILLIEDCAHIIPDDRSNPVGKYGDMVLLSFGRDKAISGVSGGAVICRRADLSNRLSTEEECAVDMSTGNILQLLSYPPLYFVSRPFFGLLIGKALLTVARAAGILPAILSDTEKEGRMSPVIRRLPNALAFLALSQWRQIGALNEHRRILTSAYIDHAKKYRWPFVQAISSDMTLQKFPLFTRQAERIRKELKKRNIHLDDGWTGCVICPETIDLEATDYQTGDDPQAEAVCELILSLPIHPTMSLYDAEKLMKLIDPYLL